jgi:cellulose synthase/poly-beta-1,6-N-acetylglucosamine synthase-like glycosyltransferase
MNDWVTTNWVIFPVHVIAWFFLVYFTALFVFYFLINAISSGVLIWKTSQAENYGQESIDRVNAAAEAISVLVPAYNESATITASVHSLLKLDYPEYEIIVVNDGSKDETLNILIQDFDLVVVSQEPLHTLPTQPVRAVYQSVKYSNLRIVDKVNGGKADALNAGITFAEHGFFCCIDADSILHPHSLTKLMQPFLEDEKTVACGGTVYVVNGCSVKDGALTQVGLTQNIFALFQIVEYLRTLLFGRLGWASFNSLLIISGAFGLFRKDKVLTVGGYAHGTIGEDMELVVRLHRVMRQQKEPYRIAFVPDPLCWTEVPEDWQTLKNQRVRWQRGLCESVIANRELLFNLRGGAAAWIALPFMLFFELFGPIIEVLGYVFVAGMLVTDVIQPFFAFVLFCISVFLCTLTTINAILVQEVLYGIYRKPWYIFLLVMLAIMENFGYHQLTTYWRIVGLWRWFRGRKSVWGEMRRTGQWDKSYSRHEHDQTFDLMLAQDRDAARSDIERFDPSRFAGRVVG